MARHNSAIASSWIGALLWGACVAGVSGTSLNWVGTTGDWFATANWSPAQIPTNGDQVTIAAAKGVILSNSTFALDSLTLAGTLTFTNWDTLLTATTITVQSNGIIQHAACQTNPIMANTNRVYVSCSNLTVAAGGFISVDGLGHRGCTNHPANANYTGDGPGAANGSCGGGYGGVGAYGAYGGFRGPTYGSSNAPIEPGSGGGAHNADDGAPGGGAICMAATGVVTVNGTVTANGLICGWQGGGWQGGSGSGGGIYITCASLTGTGVIRANGGPGRMGQYEGCGGGGGRIAIIYSTLDSFTGSRIVNPGTGYVTGPNAASNGTIYIGYTGSDILLSVAGDPGAYGTSAPYAYGMVTPLPAGTTVTNYVNTPAPGGPGLQYASIGWRLATNGVSVDSGSSTQAAFQIPSQYCQLTWLWTNTYLLAVTNGANGTVPVNLTGYYTNGTDVSLTATAGVGYVFWDWSGDVDFAARTSNPIVLKMDRPRSVQANFVGTSGVAKIWQGTGRWWSSTNWTPPGMPGPLDSALLASGSNLLDSPVQMLSLTVSNGATLTVTNWTSTIAVTNGVAVLSGGTITHADCNTNPVLANTNRVSLSCANLFVEIGGSITVDGKGYRGCTNHPANQNYWGDGPGAGNGGYGGSYGGFGPSGGYGGGQGPTYGPADSPEEPGSGGGAHNANDGTSGGGAVRIVATGTVTVNGTITAKGTARNGQSGGGSGGAIYITCATFAGTNGLVGADGGDGGAALYDGGGGGGGRIAVRYNAAAQSNANLTARPTVNFSANSGWGGYLRGWPGTLYFTDTSFFPGQTIRGGQLVIPGFTSWAPAGLTVTQDVVAFPAGFQLAVSNNLTSAGDGVQDGGIWITNGTLQVGGNLNLLAGARGRSSVYLAPASTLNIGTSLVVRQGSLTIAGNPAGDSVLQIGDDCTITNGGTLWLYGGLTNGAAPVYGFLVNVADELRIGPSSWVYAYSHPTNGGSILFRTTSLSIATNGGISGDAGGLAGGYAAGDTWGYGAGRGFNSWGAGYGGIGGQGGYGGNGGVTYGSSNAPVDTGSGGGGHNGQRGGRGGGVIRIETTKALTLDGTISANGGDEGGQSGAGSGGSIYIKCRTLNGGTGGLFRANGGNSIGSYGCSGGGGRIAVWRVRSFYLGNGVATNGVGWNFGQPGTVVWGWSPPGGTLFIMH